MRGGFLGGIMFRLVTLLAIVLVLAACGTIAQQVDPQQEPPATVIERVAPPDACHVVLTLTNDGREVEFTPSDQCERNEVVLAEVVNTDGDRLYDGGVIGGGSETSWPVRPGVHRVRERGGGDLIATITTE